MPIVNHAIQDANAVLAYATKVEAKMAEAFALLRATGVSIQDEPFLRLERALSDVKGEAFRVVRDFLDAEDGKAKAH
ncbi:hypothetical protein [Herbaspirillum robiniae]|uniref:hypothetical protein n=1 Tax=Herbaspirillum robiniae TaxID=2014887 RepID=UPI0009A13BAA|nr:hypothetical protein [Herbaspirillum robiniae]